MPTRRVAIVAQDEAIRTVLGEILSQAGFEVASVGAVDDAHDMLLQQHLDLILIDCLTGGDSLEPLLAELSAGEKGPSILLISTTNTQALAKRWSLPLLTMPFDLDDLLGVLDELGERPSRPQRAPRE